jgi:type II secretion system protein H
VKGSHANGFTLIEVLVVITIVGVMAGVATFAFGNLDGRWLQSEAGRLRQVLNHAVDTALMDQTNLKWTYQAEHKRYRFEILDREGEWQPAPGAAFEAHQFERAVEVDLEQPGQPFDRDDAALYFSASGEYSPFRLALKQGDNTWVLSGDGINTVVPGEAARQ